MNRELWKTSDVKPYEHNLRLNDAAVNAVAKSIGEFGFRQPIVVDIEGVIICGHTRYKAAQRLGRDILEVVTEGHRARADDAGWYQQQCNRPQRSPIWNVVQA